MNFQQYMILVRSDTRIQKLDFSPTNKKHYVYRITDITNHTYYYGSRSTINSDIYTDFWNYGTSSIKKRQILENQADFRLKIIKVFDNVGDMICYESFLHEYFKVSNNDRFWNKSNQLPWGFTTNGLRWKDNLTSKINKTMAIKKRIDNRTIEQQMATYNLWKHNRLMVDPVTGLNSFDRAGVKISNTKRNKTLLEKKAISKKRLNTIGVDGIKDIHHKGVITKAQKGINSKSTTKRNLTIANNRNIILDKYYIRVTFVDNTIQEFKMKDIYHGKACFPSTKYYTDLKHYGMTKVIGIDAPHTYIMQFSKHVLPQHKYKSFHNAKIEKIMRLSNI